MHCPRRSSHKNCAAKIQRIPCESVRSRRREHFLLFQIPSRVCPQPEADNSNSGSAKYAFPIRSREGQNNNRQRIAQTHSPPRNPFCRSIHEVAFTRLIALSTSSTET